MCDAETDDFRTRYYINMRNEKGASHMAAALYEMQRCGVDAAMFYDAQLWKEYGPLFRVPELEPTPAYAAFERFGRLFALGTEYESTQADDVYTLAAGDGKAFMLALANVSAAPRELCIELCGARGEPVFGGDPVCRGIQKTAAGQTLTLTLPGYGCCEIAYE